MTEARNRMSESDVCDGVLRVLRDTNIVVNSDADYKCDFETLGVNLDSVGMLQIIIGLENHFHCEMMPDEVNDVMFGSPKALVEFLLTKLAHRD